MQRREETSECGCAEHAEGSSTRPASARLSPFFVIDSDIDEYIYRLCFDCGEIWEECFEFGCEPGIWTRLPFERLRSPGFWASFVLGDNPFPGFYVTENGERFAAWVRQLDGPEGVYRGI